jgi:hypothetical protein
MHATRPANVVWLGFALLGVAAAGLAIELARPVQTASIAFDSQVAVLHFLRLVEGHRLEVLLSTTPKPLLTVLYGPAYALFGDWRPVAWLAIAAYVADVILAAALAYRLGGAIAAAFGAVAIMMVPTLLFDVGFALATPWALLLWLAAGFAVSAARPRWLLAGIALGLASLARLETLVVVGTAIVALGWGSFAPIRLVPAGRRPPRAAWLTPLAALGAIPVMLVHDALLTGDPFYWTTVAARYSAATRMHVMSPAEVLRFLVDRYWSSGALSLLAVAGVARLWIDRQRAVVVGLVGLGPGIAAFLVLLAVRGIFVSDRYAAGIDVAVAFSAAFGFGWLARIVVAAAADRVATLRHWQGAALVGVSAVLALVIAGPYWLVDRTVRPAVHGNLRLAADSDRSVPVLMAGLADAPAPASSQPRVLVPVPVLPRMAIDLDLLIGEVAGTDAARVDVTTGYPAPGQLMLHSRAGDPALPGFEALEVSEPTVVGEVTVDPLLADPDRGLWNLRIR